MEYSPTQGPASLYENNMGKRLLQESLLPTTGMSTLDRKAEQYSHHATTCHTVLNWDRPQRTAHVETLYEQL